MNLLNTKHNTNISVTLAITVYHRWVTLLGLNFSSVIESELYKTYVALLGHFIYQNYQGFGGNIDDLVENQFVIFYQDVMNES